MKKWHLFGKNTFLMNRLMKVYSLLLTGIILLAMAALCVFTARSNYHQTEEKMKSLENRVTSYVIDKQNTMSFLYMGLASSNEAVDNIRKYLSLTPNEYFNYTQKAWEAYQKDTRISTTVNSFFNSFPDLKEIYVKLDESNVFLHANEMNHAGKKERGGFNIEGGVTLRRTIIDQYSFEIIGELVAVFSDEEIMESQGLMMKENKMDAFIFDPANYKIFGTDYSLSKNQVWEMLDTFKQTETIPASIEKDYFITKKTSSSSNTYILLASKEKIRQENWKMFRVIISVGLFLTAVLLLTLHRTFKRYFKQVGEIVEITQKVSKGDLEERIDLLDVEDELYDLSKAINYMIGSMDKYIHENYELEIKQRDAHMQALQSQINPHFLYNTLEYIRMYALSKQQKELAEVVFAFSALLRNNTTQEKTTTLKKELSFCEKYVYLYQMRYPDRVAYFFQVDPRLSELEIPKFSIQPLIENYFVHGIDYTQNSNAISVKAYIEENDICILITDNGKGISKERLAEIQENLTKKQDEAGSSIGLKNVNFRLKHFFKDQVEMTISSEKGNGTKILLRVIEGADLLV